VHFDEFDDFDFMHFDEIAVKWRFVIVLNVIVIRPYGVSQWGV